MIFEKVWVQAGTPEFLGVRIRIGLLRSSILTRGRGISEKLFSQCLAAGVISPTLVEVIAALQATPAKRSRYFELIAEYTDPHNSRLWQEALAAARQIVDHSERASALSLLAEKLGLEAREGALQEALAAARQAVEDDDSTWKLIELAEKLGPEARERALREALAAARQIADHHWRAAELSMVARKLGLEARERALQEALTAARQIVDHYDRARAFILLAGCLEVRERALQEALATARQAVDHGCRAKALRLVAEHLVRRSGESVARGADRRAADRR